MASIKQLEEILALGREYGAALIEMTPEGAVKVIFTEGGVPEEGDLPDENPEPPSDDPYARLFKGDTPKFNRE